MWVGGRLVRNDEATGTNDGACQDDERRVTANQHGQNGICRGSPPLAASSEPSGNRPAFDSLAQDWQGNRDETA
ncbi:hypothetical protein ACJ72_08575, partial [Emergomyces africanus]